MNRHHPTIVPSAALLRIGFAALILAAPAAALVDTGQQKCFDDAAEMVCPAEGEAFHGQDAQYGETPPAYVLSGDGLTVFDARTGLTWVKTPDTDGDGDLDSDDKLTWTEFADYPAMLNAAGFGGFDDWRRPTIRELYSLIDFRGVDPSGMTGSTEGFVPFLDTEYFDFAYGDESVGERIIDAQYWSSTEYVGTVFDGQAAVFGVNFADGRIKGYPRDTGPGGTMTQFVRLVRGGAGYGANEFIDNGDGTVTDRSTGLTWMQDDSGVGMNWEDALAYAEGLVFAGHDDWRLPNAKELQSIVDYDRSPSTTGTAAIDPVFSCTPIVDEGGSANYPFYWTSTTHENMSLDAPGGYAVYVAFGEALGWMQVMWPPPPEYELQDVHGAGAQRSDPKTGDPADFPYGHGPQGDVVRIDNYVRCVRDDSATEIGSDGGSGAPRSFALAQNRPNPFNPITTISFRLPESSRATLRVVDASGRSVATLVEAELTAGDHEERWTADGLPSGVYFGVLTANGRRETIKMVLLR